MDKLDKRTVKKKLLEAIERDPHKKDFKRVSIFGSYAYGKPGKRSDVDVLIEFKPKARVGYFKLAHIQDNFKKAVGRKVDLLTPGALSEFFKDEVLQNAKKIYETR
jgi:uncharacterized protein